MQQVVAAVTRDVQWLASGLEPPPLQLSPLLQTVLLSAPARRNARRLTWVFGAQLAQLAWVTSVQPAQLASGTSPAASTHSSPLLPLRAAK